MTGGIGASPAGENPVSPSCGTCKRNRDAVDRGAREAAFEMAREDRNQACRNYLLLAVALPKRDIPVIVRLPNTSFKAWAYYCQKIGTEGRFRPCEVVTEIALENVRTKTNAEISQAVFRMVGPLPALARARRRASHCLRGGAMPEPDGMLRSRYGHFSAARAHLHQTLHLLRR